METATISSFRGNVMRNRFLACSLALILGNARADLPGSIAALRGIGAGGKGNAQAASAWKELVGHGPAALAPALGAMDDEDPVSANWLRPALDAIVEKAGADAIPSREVEQFLEDRKGGRMARACALELVRRKDPARADAFLAKATDDPSPEIRRQAIAAAIAKAPAEGPARVDAMKALFKVACDRDQVDQIAKDLGKAGIKTDLAAHFGYIMDWSVIGPFPVPEATGYGVKFPPEDKLDLAGEVAGPKGPLKWKQVKTADPAGLVNLNKELADEKSVVAYAYTRIESAGEQRVVLRAGSITALKVFLNGKEVYGKNEYHHGMHPDQHQAIVVLKPGMNEILLKVCQNQKAQSWEKNWQYQVRLTDFTGARVSWKQGPVQ